VAVSLRFFVGELVWVPSGSMEPTVREGELVLVSKWQRVFRGPHTFKPGEVIVFRSKMEPNVLLLKRLVAVGGDNVRIVPGEGLWVNDQKVTTVISEDEVRELWLGTTTTLKWQKMTAWEFEVPQGHFLAFGDNRDNSADSRMYGAVPLKNIIGRAKMVLWSCAEGAVGPGCNFSLLRRDRVFAPLGEGG
jgi:signal peptidase I